MWGENWIEFFWGGGPLIGTPVASIPINSTALLVLGILIGACGARLARKGHSRLLMTSIVILYPLATLAVSLPHVFVNGEVADASQVNENFDALSAAIDSLPVITNIDGLAGGKLSSDLIVSGTVQANEFLLPNGKLSTLGSGLVLTHASGAKITLNGADIVLEIGNSTLTLTPDTASLASENTTLKATETALVDGVISDIKGSAQVIIHGGLVKIN